ncbi:hypothetical protein MMC20_007743 [Loxospora ochrophaea]|nr:hypothetical protein [Loxospora ochrophaea]
MAQTNPFLLAADDNPSLLPLLRSNPSLASSQDAHGYSLIHAAVSYNHLDLLRALANEFKVDINLKDEDGETALFVVETVDAAQVLLEELGADMTVTNVDGMTAEEKIRTDGDYVTVAEYLRESRVRGKDGSLPHSAPGEAPASSSNTHLPPLPPNVTINLATMEDAAQPGSSGTDFADPEFRRRIEELASRDDFAGEDGQRQLRELITDAVREVGGPISERDVRQRLE